MSDEKCFLCPRRCGAARDEFSGAGACHAGTVPVVARAAAHFGEEPCISGSCGSGAIFFCGCGLGCVFCQNSKISRGVGIGKPVSILQLRDIFRRLEDQDVHNINLVTASHFAPAVAEALAGIELSVPVIWNSSGYELPETLRMLDGLIDIYMPDMKYSDPHAAGLYSHAPDYPEIAKAAIAEMYRQTGPFEIDDDEGILQKGVLIRHLIMPGETDNTFGVIDWIADSFDPGQVLFSLMAQYTPMASFPQLPNLSRSLTQREYDLCAAYLEASGISDGYFQELSASGEDSIPDFDCTGV